MSKQIYTITEPETPKDLYEVIDFVHTLAVELEGKLPDDPKAKALIDTMSVAMESLNELAIEEDWF